MNRNAPSAPRPGLFRDILLAPDRERIPNARPVVSFDAADDSEFVAEVRRRATGSYTLRRRGVDHGVLVELNGAGLLGPRPRRRRRLAIEAERWCAGAPLFLPEAVLDLSRGDIGRRASALHRRLDNPGGLGGYVEERGPAAGRFTVQDLAAPLADSERDLARVVLSGDEGEEDLWLKAGRLSTHADDRSLRLRVSFGVEGEDDASRDERRHAATTELARGFLPGAAGLADADELWETVTRLVGAPAYGAQHIAYWNAPGGGARFHHDSFAEDMVDAERGVVGQRGVLYTQFAGRTAWLALSIEALAACVWELISWLEDGELPHLKGGLGDRWDAIRSLKFRRDPSLAELANPGCGVFEPLIDAPEFTAYLADAGHALVLHPGDALLLPNHGPQRTAMHSVFTASDELTYSLSVALRVAP